TSRHNQSPPARETNLVGIGSLCEASSRASRAVASSMPAISNMMRPGLTTATHFSGAPLPLPMRVSAGFLVKGLSGKIRIQSFPPRLMNRVIATREASIWRSVIQAFSMALSPYSPNERSPPRHALPLRRPRICFLYFTFFGINIVVFSLPCYARPRSGRQFRFVASVRRDSFGLILSLFAPRDIFTLINPALHTDHAVGGLRFRGSEIDVRAQRLQRQTAQQVPLFTRDFRTVQPAGNAHFDALAAKTQSRIDGLAHRAAKRHALFE